MTLKFSSIKTDAAFTGKTTKAGSPGSVLDKKKKKTSQAKVQSQGKRDVCVFDYVMSICAARQHLMLKYDILSRWNDFEASSYLGRFGACWNKSRQEEYLGIYLSLS